MSAEVADMLRRAKARIDTPEKWLQGSAFDGSHLVGSTRFCMVGALCAAEQLDTEQLATFRIDEEALMCLRRATRGVSLGVWNDAPERSHAEVMEAFDKAIALAEAQQ